MGTGMKDTRGLDDSYLQTRCQPRYSPERTTPHHNGKPLSTFHPPTTPPPPVPPTSRHAVYPTSDQGTHHTGHIRTLFYVLELNDQSQLLLGFYPLLALYSVHHSTIRYAQFGR